MNSRFSKVTCSFCGNRGLITVIFLIGNPSDGVFCVELGVNALDGIKDQTHLTPPRCVLSVNGGASMRIMVRRVVISRSAMLFYGGFSFAGGGQHDGF